jgi:hypothetical protein
LKAAHSRHTLRILGHLAKCLVIVGLLGLIVRVLLINLPELRRHSIKCDAWLLVASLALLALHLLITSMLWHLFTVVNRASIPLGAAIVAWFYSMLGKYIPGKVFLWAGRTFYYHREGQSIKRITFCLLLDMALQLLASCLVIAVALAWSPHMFLSKYRSATWILIAVVALGVNPRVLRLVLNRGLRLLRREPVVVAMRQRDIAAIVAGYTANCLLLGLAFFCFVNALHPTPVEKYLFLTGAFLVAGWTGVLAVFAPGGLGVRDSVLLVALCTMMPDSTAAVVVLAARVWTTAAELICVSLAFCYDRWTKRRAEGTGVGGRAGSERS